MNVNRFEELLLESNYNREETQFLIDGFRNGFDIGYRGKIRGVQRTAPNLKIRVGSHIQLWNKVMKEVKLKRYAGPFRNPPYKDFIQSPIGLVPKDGGRDTRLIFHLSYPRSGSSINSETPDHMCSVNYADFTDAIRRCLEEIAAHGACVVAKSDMKSAFRNLGIKKEQWCLLLMAAKSPLDGKIYYFVDKCLPFGSSISCSHFSRFSDSVAHLTTYRTGKKPVNYLDDFLFVAFLKSWCDQQVSAFLNICTEINFPVSLEKTFWSTTSLTFLGLLIHTVGQYVGIPVDKVRRAQELIGAMIGKRKVTVKELQKLCGFLNFLCNCIVPGRAFLRRFYNYFSSSMKPYHHVRVNADMKADLNTWQVFLNEPTVFCRPFLDYSHVISAEELFWYTDASGRIGYGGVRNENWFSQAWSKEFLIRCKPSIQYLELFAVCVSILLWSCDYSNKRIRLFCDNGSVVNMLRTSSSGCKNCMKLIRLIVLECLTWNVRIFLRHVKTEDNFFADALSRGQMSRFWRKAAEKGRTFDKYPENIPDILSNIESSWIF